MINQRPLICCFKYEYVCNSLTNLGVRVNRGSEVVQSFHTESTMSYDEGQGCFKLFHQNNLKKKGETRSTTNTTSRSKPLGLLLFFKYKCSIQKGISKTLCKLWGDFIVLINKVLTLEA